MTNELLGLTPSQTVGPYLSIGLLDELVTSQLVARTDPGAIVIHGFLLDGAGDPVPDGMIELWQADENGNYLESTPEEGFKGFGRSGTIADGRFEFVTVRPGRVSWPDGGLQAPHLEIGVFARGLLKRLVTRLYFPDEAEANASDPVLSGIPDQWRQSLIADATGDGFRFDIVLQGPNQTTFFAV